MHPYMASEPMTQQPYIAMTLSMTLYPYDSMPL